MASQTTAPSAINVPNALTVLRLILVPVFVWLLFNQPDDLTWRLWSTGAFVVAIATDAVDGRIARKYNLITNFGKIWDPIADKALTGAAFIGLSLLGELPWWVTVIILLREWGITWMRVGMLKYAVLSARSGGKLKTVLQSVALILYLPGIPLLPASAQWIAWIAWIVMGAAFLLTVVSGLDYVREAWVVRRRVRDERAGTGA